MVKALGLPFFCVSLFLSSISFAENSDIMGYNRLMKGESGGIIGKNASGLFIPIPNPDSNGRIEGFDKLDLETQKQYINWVEENQIPKINNVEQRRIIQKFLSEHPQENSATNQISVTIAHLQKQLFDLKTDFDVTSKEKAKQIITGALEETNRLKNLLERTRCLDGAAVIPQATKRH